MGIKILLIVSVVLLNKFGLCQRYNTSKVLEQLGSQINGFVDYAGTITNHRKFESEERTKVQGLVIGHLIPILKAEVKESSSFTTKSFLHLVRLITTQISAIQQLAIKRMEIYNEAIRSLTMMAHPSTEVIARLKFEQINLSPPTWELKFGGNAPLPNDHLNAFIKEPGNLDDVLTQIQQIGDLVGLLRRVFEEKEKECDEGVCRINKGMDSLIAMGKQKTGPAIEKLIPLQAKFMYLINNSGEGQQRQVLEFINFQKESRNKIGKLAAQFQRFGQIELAKLLEDFIKDSLSFHLISPEI